MNAGATRDGRSPRDSADTHAFWRAAGFILLFNVLLIAWMILKPGGDRVAAVVLNAAGFVGPLLVLPLCFGGLLGPMWRREASRINKQPTVITGQRWAPILLGLGIICWIFAQMLFTYYDLVLHQAPPFPSLADIGYLSLYPFFLLGILLLPARPVPVASRTRLALDGLMIMTAAVTFSWYFILGPVVQQGTETTLAKVVSIAYPLADIVLVVCLVILALRPGEHALRRAVYVLALGVGSLVVLDSIYAYRTLNETYVTGTMWDFGWPGAYMLIALGAFAVRLAPAAAASPDEALSARQGMWRSLLPYALVPAVGVLVFYAWSHSAGSGSLAAGVYLGGVLLVGLVLLRQVFTIFENTRLYNRLQGTYQEMEKKEEEVRRLNKDLEKRVAERTEQLKSAMAKQQQEAQERQRIEQDLRVARSIQQASLPTEVPELQGWQLAPYYHSAREVGGDFYDFHLLSEGRVGLAVGDATGKGVPAALVMSTTCGMLRLAAQSLSSPAEMLQRVNEALYPYIPPNMFVTCFYAILDPRSGSLTFANAGHDLPYLHRNGDCEELRARGMPLGLMPGMSYEQKEIFLHAGEAALFYSDGLVEAHDPKGEMFGFPRLRGLVAKHGEESSLGDFLLKELYTFTGEGWEQEDDITLLTLRRSRSRS
jgi:serine phosphatase RsbU (regulator of sigma subunit)